MSLTLLLALAHVVSPAGARSTAVPFGALLNSPDEIRLAGGSASRMLAFRCEPHAVPADGGALHLWLRHSPSLDGNRSFLSVTLNYGVLRSVRLERDNQNGAELVIPLPAAQLKPANELSFSVEQFAAAGAAEDTLWTAIDPRSYLSLAYQRVRPAMDLGALPAALLDPDPGRAKVLDVLAPRRASTATLEAIALLLATFARRVAPEPLRVRAVESAGDAVNPLILAGTPAEQPALSSANPGGSASAALQTGTPARLIVTGASPEAVLGAARGLIGGTVSGLTAVFPQNPVMTPATSRVWPGYIPPADSFSLAGLGVREIKFAGSAGYSVAIPLDATPDAAFLPYGAEAVLSLQWEPTIFDANPELVVELNGTALRRARLRDLSERPQFTLALPLPTRLLGRRNLLRVSLLARTGLDAAGWLLRDTRFYLPRDYRAVLPDLGLLRERLYPFSLRADLSETVLLVPDAMDVRLFGAVMQTAAALGRLMPGDRAGFSLRRVGETGAADLAASHVIFIAAGTLPDTALTRPLLPRLPSDAAVIQETASPWKAGRYLLSITAPSAAALEREVPRLLSDVWLAHLAGDTAYLAGDWPRCFTLAERRPLDESSLLTHLQARLRANWMALPGVLLLASGVLFVVLRLALARYKNSG